MEGSAECQATSGSCPCSGRVFVSTEGREERRHVGDLSSFSTWGVGWCQGAACPTTGCREPNTHKGIVSLMSCKVIGARRFQKAKLPSVLFPSSTPHRGRSKLVGKVKENQFNFYLLIFQVSRCQHLFAHLCQLKLPQPREYSPTSED